ncbi:phage portal protein [Faecalicatena fissicatena]|uniref:phage portal protein n=1 Tax=Faecalicatena fissicatena TaxID=290055 RepID=UPI00156EE181|nr:phage portal protein [Faecalicatena fissicatena]NSE32379.1 phage portal protein [Faecalicatena fissicatena]
MGFFDRLRRKPPKTQKWAQTLNGYAPVFSQFGTNIYASDVVQQAIKCIVDEMKKLNPVHIRYNGNDPVPVNSDIQTVLNNPNPLMTTSEFLEKVMWLLLLNYNAFILPTYYMWEDERGIQKRKYSGLYPLKPTQVDFIEDASGQMYVKMRFENNFETTVPYDDLIHIKYNYSINEYMGGDVSGQPDHTALLKTLELNDTLLRGIAKAMNSSYAVNGVVKYNTMLDDGKMEAALKELERKLNNSESGFLPLDLKAEYTPLQHEIKLVDEETLKFIDEKILRNWGVPLSILTGDYTKSQYEAFYQKTLEPLIISISQAFTKKLFTDRERSFGNRIELYPKDLIFMTVEQTLEMVNLLSNTGSIYENEKRVAFGLRPLPELEGKRYMSLNWVDMDIANQYQVGKNKKEGETDGSEE